MIKASGQLRLRRSHFAKNFAIDFCTFFVQSFLLGNLISEHVSNFESIEI